VNDSEVSESLIDNVASVLSKRRFVRKRHRPENGSPRSSAGSSKDWGTSRRRVKGRGTARRKESLSIPKQMVLRHTLYFFADFEEGDVAENCPRCQGNSESLPAWKRV